MELLCVVVLFNDLINILQKTLDFQINYCILIDNKCFFYSFSANMLDGVEKWREFRIIR